MHNRLFRRLGAFTMLAALAGAAQAHSGHGSHGLMQGLAHPLAADHLLALLAVGLWSVSALPPGQVWRGPTVFLLAMGASALAGMAGATLPLLEHGVALTTVLFGAMLVLATRPLAMPPAIGLVLIAAAAALHGLAHGAEAPAAGASGYALGLLVTTAALHLAGVGVGVSIQRWLGARAGLGLRGLGLGLGAAGLSLFVQLAA